MDDPTSRPVRPPAYALESSSGESDWDEEQEAAHPRPSHPLAKESSVETRGPALSKGGHVIFLVGESGERIAKGVPVQPKQQQGTTVLVDGHQVALVHSENSSVLVFLTPAVPLGAMYPLAKFLFETLSPSTAIIVSSYHFPSYLPSSPARIRYLCPKATPETTSLAKAGVIHAFTPPNLLHGLPASLLTVGALRSSSNTNTNTNVLLLLLPSIEPPLSLNHMDFSTAANMNSVVTSYDAGGPTDLSDPQSIEFETRGALLQIRKVFDWNWWSPEERNGRGFEWLDKLRRKWRRDAVADNAMYL